MNGKRIGMLMGGHNAEHEVSMNTGRALAEALRRRGHQVIDIVADTELAAALRRERIEIAFVALHGRWGEDGCVQGMLEAMRIPYTGSGVLASALAMDKVFAKNVLCHRGLPVLEDVVLGPQAREALTPADLPFDLPAVVKPSREGSSVGVSIVRDSAELASALDAARQLAGDVIIERYVDGREVQVAVLDGQAMGAIEVVPAEEFYNYKAKYHHGGTTQYLFPAPLDAEQNERVLALGAAVHQCLGCEGVTRIDTMLDDAGQFYVLELNTIPGMTEASLVPKIAAGLGMSFEDLAERMLQGARLKA